ncbi:hypothetical protein [Methylomonas albis]|nr:hypothetical protein [Methylomonas albis]
MMLPASLLQPIRAPLILRKTTQDEDTRRILRFRALVNPIAARYRALLT